MTEKTRGVAIESRLIPFPASISAEARSAMERLVDDAGVPVNSRYAMPAPDDHSGWTALKVAADAQYAAAVRGLAGSPRAKAETIHIDDTRIHVASPERGDPRGSAFLDFHGGALVFGGGEACLAGARMHADRHGIACYGVDYRMPPEHPYPAALDDAIAAYRHALERHAPDRIVVGGRSAGGNIAAAMLLRARDEGLPMPAGLVLLSPQVDLTESGDSFVTNRLIDVVLPASLMSNNLLYAAGADPAHPLLSPLFGDLTGFPPTLLQTGTRDLFLSNTVRMHRALRRVGIPADLIVFEGMPHGGFMGGTPEDAELAEEVCRFVAARLA